VLYVMIFQTKVIKTPNKRLNSDNVKLSWFWQTTQKATPTHCALGGR
jgi:hypothetical protein